MILALQVPRAAGLQLSICQHPRCVTKAERCMIPCCRVTGFGAYRWWQGARTQGLAAAHTRSACTVGRCSCGHAAAYATHEHG